MRRRGFTVSVMFALAGCASSDGKLEIRPTAASPAQAAKPPSERVREAQAQLASGNVALALELFRKAERELPSSVEALVGMAMCYDRMGRYDLSSRNLEAALAREPHNANILKLLSGSFAMLGRTAEAQAARSHAEALAGSSRAASVTVRLPPPRSAATSEARAAQVEALPPRASSVTVALPAAENVAPVRRTDELVSSASLPRIRLERVSPGETALVTTGRSPWYRIASGPPLFRRLNGSAASVRLLNAARLQGLAAQARLSLQRRGWKNVAIGDALKVRERTLVLYSTENRLVAKQLATQFGFALAREPRPGRVTVLLGRDALNSVRAKRT